MPQSHKCPCCGETIWRREVKTCGSPQCLAEWRAMPLTQRAKATEIASTEYEEKQSLITITPPIDAEKELDRIFGKKGGKDS